LLGVKESAPASAAGALFLCVQRDGERMDGRFRAMGCPSDATGGGGGALMLH
jgi:hypothetical protein